MDNMIPPEININSFKDYADSYPSPFIVLAPVLESDVIIDFTYEYANEAAAISNNLKVEDFLGKRVLDIFPGHRNNGVFEGLKDVYLTGRSWSMSIHYDGPAGTSYMSGYFVLNGTKIKDNVVVGWVEFTQLKMIEDSLRASEEKLLSSLAVKELLIKEKELLIKEAHHRIKNNLQLVSSLIRLHIAHSEKIDKDFLKTIENKIYSISLLHEHLYQSISLSRVSLNSYLGDLLKYLIQSYDLRNIDLDVEMEDSEVETDAAINIGLIVNEIVTNSIKHAFKDLKSSEIKLRLFYVSGHICLTISDNGIGLKPDFNISESKSLGLQLVQTLVEQLSAQMNVQSAEGTRFEIIFK